MIRLILPHHSTHIKVQIINLLMDQLTNIGFLHIKNVKGLDDHDVEMDDIGQQAMDSYQQLMNLGMNVGDREAGHIFDSASKMLKTALEAKESKINAKLKQIDLMVKKARLDGNSSDSASGSGGKSLDRNELLRIINNKGE